MARKRSPRAKLTPALCARLRTYVQTWWRRQWVPAPPR